VTRRKQAVAALLLLAGCAARRPATVVFLSDFGTADDAVAICKGVMLGIEPRLGIVDLTHQVPPWSVREGARFLAGAAPFYPAGTVFLAVVDPGVGGPRRAIVVETGRGQYFVVPDNGLATLVVERDGLREAREIVNPRWMRGTRSSTFHGRDVFAPVAARIARGEDWTQVGPPIAEPVRLPRDGPRREAGGLVGEVAALDGPYGNLVTNVDAEELGRLGYGVGDTATVTIGGRSLRLPFVRTFADVGVGRPLLYIDSHGQVGIAVNQGSFAEAYGVRPGAAVVIAPKAP